MPSHSVTSTELILFKDVENPHTEMSYTSLRDLLSANRHVCIDVEAQSKEDATTADERPAIKNRLVELAARAYLLPSRAQDSSARGNQLFFSRQWTRFTWSLRHRHNQSSLNLQAHVPCLPSGPLIWVDITRAFFCSLFKLRPQPALRL